MKRFPIILVLFLIALGLGAQEPLPVTNLQYEVKGSNRVRFTWDFPEGYTTHSQAISWSDCEYYDLIGAATHINWPCAHRFDTVDLQDYVGWRITAVGFMPTQDRTDYSIRIWKGKEEPELCYDAPVGNDTILFTMNYYALNEDVFIEEGKQLWIGFNTDDPYGRWPWAIDDGPAEAGKGDLIWMSGGFVSMSNDIGYDYNFCIRAYIESPEGEQKVIGWETEPTENEFISGYNIYLNGQLSDFIHSEIPLSYDYSCFEDWSIDFAVKAVYGDQESESVSISVAPPDDDRWFWKVITQPEGFEMDEDGNITISTAEGMAWLIAVINGYNCQPGSNLNGKTISLVNNIDLSEGRWTSLKCYMYGVKATFEGNGHTISGLHGAGGLFANFAGNMRNLNLADCDFQNTGGSPYSGSLAVQTSNAIIDNCHVTNTTVNSQNSCGGLVGFEDYSTIRNCSFTDGNIITNNIGGGLVGTMRGSHVENSYFIGNIMNPSGNHATTGGIMGIAPDNENYNPGRIWNCYAALLESDTPELVAGIVGTLKAADATENCYSLWPQEICLDNQGTIENCVMFDGGGNDWHLLEPVMVGGLQTDDLLTALDHWVTDQTVADTYFNWREDTEMTNHGLPIFGELYDALDDDSNGAGTIIYPNPTTSLLTIAMDDFSRAEVYDLMGRRIKQSQQPTLDLHGLPQGIYEVKVFDNTGNSIIRKVIKQ